MKKLIPFLLAAVALLAAATSAVVDHYSTADLAAMQEERDCAGDKHGDRQAKAMRRSGPHDFVSGGRARVGKR